MATFNVGQRVKKIAHSTNPRARHHAPIGSVGTIVAATTLFGYEWLVDYDEVDPKYSRHFYAYSHQLAPLTDPKADEFIERIKNLKPYEEPTVTKREVVNQGKE